MRKRSSPTELKLAKAQILVEYEKTQVLADIAKTLNLPISRVAYYARTLNLKGTGNTSFLTPELEEKIRLEYSLNPNLFEITQKLNLNYSTMQPFFRKMGLKNVRKTTIIWVDDTHVECSKCSKILLYEELEKIRATSEKPSRVSYCRDCRTKQTISNNKSSLESYLANRIRAIRTRAKTNNIQFDLTTDYLLETYKTQQGKCFYTNVEMSIPQNNNQVSMRSNLMSVDKIRPELGYIKGNIVICSLRANNIKGDLTLDEMKVWLPEWHKKLVLLNNINSTS